MLTTALFFLYLSTRNPPAPNPPEVQAPAAKQDPLVPPDSGSDSDRPEIAAEDEADTTPKFPSQLVTLGSMDAESNYQLLVTLTSRGAGIERAELVGQEDGRFHYRALEHDAGYLGHLGLDDQATVRSVPPGSPAAAAKASGVEGGLQVGDRLQEVAGQPVSDADSLRAALQGIKPGQEVELTAIRGSASDAATLQFTTLATETPLDIIRIHARPREQVEGNFPQPSLKTTLGSLNGKFIPVGQSAFPSLEQATLNADWEVNELEVPGGDGVEFRLPLESFLAGSSGPKQLDLVKRYRLLPAGDASDGYLLDLETLIVNHGEEPIQASFRQQGLNGLTLEGWWFSVKISPHLLSAAGQRDVMYNSEASFHQLVTTRQIADQVTEQPGKPYQLLFGEGEPEASRTLKYIGLDSQYFNASLLPHPESPQALTNLRQAATTVSADPELIPKSKKQATNTAFWFDTAEQSIAPGGELSQRYQVFIGPKDSDLLAAHQLDRAIEYGWFPWIAKPLGWILHFFHSIVRNYGLAIVLLTVMVRGMMFPLGRKAAANAQKMQELQPELKAINEKYKDNMEKRAAAMRELYTKHNFKPLAGCLPMFIQLPIFIGLYRCLSVDISLRQEPLIPGVSWCSNLAGPDMLMDWSSWMPEFIAGRGTGWLGPYFNLLPIMTVLLFIVQQKMLMPKATDEQTRMTQNMMQVMTIFMGVLFFKVPSGLCIYFITSSLWSLVERKLVQRLAPAKATPTPAQEPAEPTSKRATGKGRDRSAPQSKPKGRMQELMEMLDKPAVKSGTQRGTPKSSRPHRKKDKKRR